MITHTSGGDPIPEGFEVGVFTPTENEYTHTVRHSFGIVPRTAIVIGTLNGGEGLDNKTNIMCEYLMSDFADRIFDRTRTGAKCPNAVITVNGTTGEEYQSTNVYTTYPASMTATDVTFATGRYYGGKFMAGHTYLYVITK